MRVTSASRMFLKEKPTKFTEESAIGTSKSSGIQEKFSASVHPTKKKWMEMKLSAM